VVTMIKPTHFLRHLALARLPVDMVETVWQPAFAYIRFGASCISHVFYWQFKNREKKLDISTLF